MQAGAFLFTVSGEPRINVGAGAQAVGSLIPAHVPDPSLRISPHQADDPNDRTSQHSQFHRTDLATCREGGRHSLSVFSSHAGQCPLSNSAACSGEGGPFCTGPADSPDTTPRGIAPPKARGARARALLAEAVNRRGARQRSVSAYGVFAKTAFGLALVFALCQRFLVMSHIWGFFSAAPYTLVLSLSLAPPVHIQSGRGDRGQTRHFFWLAALAYSFPRLD